MKDEYEPEKWKRRGERMCPLAEERRSAQALDFLRTSYLWGRPGRLTTYRDRGRTHTRGRAEGGAGVPQPPENPSVSTCAVEQTLSPGPRLPGKTLGPVVARYPDVVLFPERREIWISMQNPTIMKCL